MNKKEKAKMLKILKSYRNPDPRCSFPWEPKYEGFCRAYADYIDGHAWVGIPGEKGFCKKCEFWKKK